jgi:transcriptional regulator with XRE-family HTH domain
MRIDLSAATTRKAEPRVDRHEDAATAAGPSPEPAGTASGLHVEDPVTRSEMARALGSLRITRGWSQHEVARSAGLHKSAISEYERGKKMPEMATIARLLAALGYTIEDLHAALAFVRGRDHAERMPATGHLDPRAHRLAVDVARATYACWYAALVVLPFLPASPGEAQAAAAGVPMPGTEPGAGVFRA